MMLGTGGSSRLTGRLVRVQPRSIAPPQETSHGGRFAELLEDVLEHDGTPGNPFEPRRTARDQNGCDSRVRLANNSTPSRMSIMTPMLGFPTTPPINFARAMPTTFPLRQPLKNVAILGGVVS